MATSVGKSKIMSLKSKKKHIKTVTQKVKLFRAKDPLMSVFMWGVNHTLHELQHVSIPVLLMPEDFKAYSKTKIDNHLFNKENMPSHFKVKEYCPLVFRNLRERFGVEDGEYLNSICKAEPIPTDSPGRSNSQFWMSYDRRFVVKTVASEEIEQLHHILKDYHQHVVERMGDMLLPHLMGTYRLTVDNVETYLLVMMNIMWSNLTLHRKFDLKGSLINRAVKEKEKTKELPTFKDQDFVDGGHMILIGKEAKEKFMQKLEADVNFLIRSHLMDYSLLVGVHDLKQAEEDAANATREGRGETNGRIGSATSGGASGVDSDGGVTSDGDVFDEEDECDTSDIEAAPTPPESPGREGRGVQFAASVDVDNPENYNDNIFCIPAREGAEKPEIYFLGIIDVLTHYGVRKQAAYAAKTVKHGTGAEISTVDPEHYGKRFIEFIDNHVI